MILLTTTIIYTSIHLYIYDDSLYIAGFFAKNSKFEKKDDGRRSVNVIMESS